MKKLGIIIGVLLLVSCSQEPTRESIEKEINDYKKEISQAEQQIQSLEEQLAEMGESAADGFQIPVFVKEVEAETFNHYIQANGIVEAVNQAFVSPEMSGQIKQILIQEGDRVNKGQLLVSLNTSVTENNIKEVKTNLELATKLYAKQKKLWEENVGSEIDYLQAKNNKESLENRLKSLEAQLNMSKIHAPFSGIVDEIYQKKGEMASPGMQVLRMVNLDDLTIEADISESYLGSVKAGDKVAVSFPAYPDIQLNVPINRTGKMIDQDSRTFHIEVRIDNPENKILPNLIAVVKIRDYSNENSLVVPSIIVKQDIKGNYLYVAENSNGDLVARKVYVETGRSYNDQTVIKKGIKSGDRVIVSGFNQVSDGAKISIRKPQEYDQQ